MRLPIRHSWCAAIVLYIVVYQHTCSGAANPTLGAPIFGIGPGGAQISLTNASDTNFQYVVQTSSNLQDWVSVTTNFPTGPGSLVTVPAPSSACFYRLMLVPHVPSPIFRSAIMTASGLDNMGSFTADSFDSSNPLYSTLGQYNPLLRRAGGDIADSSVGGVMNLGNANVYGHAYTGIGTSQSYVQIGPDGAVGSLAWNNSSSGIQPGYWLGNFYLNFPDPIQPQVGSPLLPAPVNGNVVLSGGNYTISATDPNISKPLMVKAPTIVWVQGSYSLPGITLSNNASLILYVGRSTGHGDSLSIGGNGDINEPGYASAFQIYGLPSVNRIAVSAGSGFIACVYAPDADAVYGSTGNGVADFSGAIVARSLTLNGHCNIHYDENLRVNGPTF